MQMNKINHINKIKIFLLCAFAMLGFNGCASSQMHVESSEPFKIIGEIESLGGISLNKKITHLLEAEDGKVYYAYSDAYNLDDEKYQNAKFEFKGNIIKYSEIERQALQIQSISKDNIEPEKAQIDQSVYEYINSSIGFSVKIQKSWELSEFDYGVKLIKNNAEQSSTINFSRHVNLLQTNGSEDQEQRKFDIQSSAQMVDTNLIDPKYISIGPDSLIGIKYTKNDGTILIFTATGRDLIQIRFSHDQLSALDLLEENAAFNEILNSFKFMQTGSNVEQKPINQDSNVL